ncbi:hypothetical protein A4H97_28475 [Niastella yeongjuensis]|uniref:HTH cro/C1-type domain-containing protein n=1 Tax=Niastella yeongjuensis TaxID=354355 RepID=A0A1V9ET00_9BACT|nr:helix-turn-helix transcriptional regulator [Niastella yeongjuensis]OQP49283.1 hypothetical protein A4H97_28475 [Niastella yeongjuensis]SEP42986.1 Helix-turn-helix [Niastella yeongjuensis]
MSDIHNFEKALGKWLLKIRVEKGISQAALGLQLGKGQSDIAKIESGAKRITVFELISWVTALNIPYERITEILKPLHSQLLNQKNNWKDDE